MLERLKSILSFVVRQPKDAAIIGLSLICIFLNWKIGVERKEAERSRVIAGDLPAGTKQIVTIYRDRVITKRREGPERVIYKERYLPPEGSVTFITEEDGHAKSTVAIKDRGWTFRLGGGAVYSGRLQPSLDAKVTYWNRYGLLIGIMPDFAGVGASRHIDDILPFRNLEVLVIGGPSWSGHWRYGIGMRSSF